VWATTCPGCSAPAERIVGHGDQQQAGGRAGHVDDGQVGGVREQAVDPIAGGLGSAGSGDNPMAGLAEGGAEDGPHPAGADNPNRQGVRRQLRRRDLGGRIPFGAQWSAHVLDPVLAKGYRPRQV
jgi:hypothetical protein